MSEKNELKAYTVKVIKTGGDVVLAYSKDDAFNRWVCTHSKFYINVEE